MNYDVIVIGGGHSGCEAALLSARNESKTLIITINMDNIAIMPFGSAIGGGEKGELLREIGSMGAEMPENIKRTCISLQRNSNNPGDVRFIVDGRRYSLKLKKVLERRDNLYLRQGLVVNINKDRSLIRVNTSDGIVYKGKSIVISTGTFLGGRIFWGNHEIEAGRQGEICSKSLLKSLEKMGFVFGLIRKYVAPMIDVKTINTRVLDKQLNLTADEASKLGVEQSGMKKKYSYTNIIGEDPENYLKEHGDELFGRNGKIWLNEGDNLSLEESILSGESLVGRKFFINPSGRDTGEVYLKGLENALPEDLQLGFIRKLNGFDKVEMTRPGYGIEYNYLVSSQLNKNLESKEVPGMFFAGKVNGSMEYEESGAQGVVAGIIGSGKSTLIDDILSKGKTKQIELLLSNITKV